MKGKGKIVVFIGGRGRGKSTLMKKMLAKVHPSRLHVYDAHGDWDRPLPILEDFILLCGKAKDCVFVFEDATGFFGSRVNNIMRQAMTRSRNNNVTIFLSFHSWRLMPPDILDLCDVIYMFKTADTPDTVMKKTESSYVLSVFTDVMKSANRYVYRLITSDDLINKDGI